jgi:hypothetical protein
MLQCGGSDSVYFAQQFAEVAVMFESFGSNRLQREREFWIERRKREEGKKMFVFLYTIIVGNGCFCLFRTPILFHFWYGRTISHHGKLVAAAVVLPLSMGIGLLFGLLLWRRGERLINSSADEGF